MNLHTNIFWSWTCWGCVNLSVCICLGLDDSAAAGPHNKTAYSRPKWSQHGVYGRDAGLGSRGRIYRLCPNGPLLQVSGGTQKPLPLPQVSRVFSLCRSSWWSHNVQIQSKKQSKFSKASVVSWRSLFSLTPLFESLFTKITAEKPKKFRKKY